MRHLIPRDVHAPVQCKAAGAFDQAFNLGAAKVLGPCRQLGQIDVVRHVVVFAHLAGVDVENLQPAHFIRQTNLDVHLEPSRSEQCRVEQIFSVGHAYHQNVVETVHAVNFAQQLVDHAVVHTGAAPISAARLANTVDLVKNDDVQPRSVLFFAVLLFCVLKQQAYILFRLAHQAREDFGTIAHLGLAPR